MYCSRPEKIERCFLTTGQPGIIFFPSPHDHLITDNNIDQFGWGIKNIHDLTHKHIGIYVIFFNSM